MSSTFGVLYNICHGGFSFSYDFIKEYNKRTNRSDTNYWADLRKDPIAIEIFEEKGSQWCSGQYSRLALQKLPKFLENYYEISDYDGMESVELNIDKYYKDLVVNYLATSKNPDPYFVNGVAELNNLLTTLKNKN